MDQIRNYGDLKLGVKKWLNRSDSRTVETIPLFINLAEKEIYRNLRIPAFEGEVILTVNDDRGVAIPSDVLEFKHIFTEDKETLSRVAIDTLRTCKKAYARTTAFLWFSEDINPGQKLHLVYYKDQKELGPKEDDTNILIAIAPDLFLYTALRAGSRFVNDVEEVSKWDTLAQKAYNNILLQTEELEFSGGTMEIGTHGMEV